MAVRPIQAAAERIAPRWSLARERARAQLHIQRQQADMNKRRYEAAQRGARGRYKWRASASDANVQIGSSLPTLRQRSSQVIRDTAYGARIADLWPAMIVGDGITLRRPDGSSASTNARIMAEWRRWAIDSTEIDAERRHNLLGLERLIARSVGERGEVLVRMLTPRRSDDVTVPLQLQVLEGDHLDIQKDRGERRDKRGRVTQTRIVQGVELDGQGRRIAYWMLPEHPGAGHPTTPRHEPVRVPAEEVLHIYRQDRPGQLRGVPWLAPVLSEMHDQEDFDQALHMKARAGAYVIGTVERPSQDGDPLMGTEGETSEGDRIEGLEQGAVFYTGEGEKFQMHEPAGLGDGSEDLARRFAEKIAVGAMATFAQVTGDLRQTNYSSMRAGALEQRKIIEQLQWSLMITQLLQPLWRAFIERGRMDGRPWPEPRAVPALWSTPRPDPIDPSKEWPALIRMVEAGLISWDEAVAERGKDPDRHAREVADRAEMLAGEGLDAPMVPDNQPALPTLSGGTEDTDSEESEK